MIKATSKIIRENKAWPSCRLKKNYILIRFKIPINTASRARHVIYRFRLLNESKSQYMIKPHPHTLCVLHFVNTNFVYIRHIVYPHFYPLVHLNLIIERASR